MKNSRRFRALFALLVIGSQATPCVSEKPARMISFHAKYVFPNGDMVEYYQVQDPIKGETLAYSPLKSVFYETMVLRYATGKEEILYRTPSEPGVLGLKATGQPMEALKDDSKVEVVMYFSPRRDTFAFYRFERKENGWRYIGHQIFSDLDSIMKGADDYRDVPKKCELVDWSTIRMTMNSGAIRTLTVDQDGQFMENGQPYVYTDKKTIRSPEFARPQEHAKAYYKGSIDRYFDPRDEDGVPLDRIAELMERAKQAQSSSAQHSVLPSSPDQVQTPPIIAGHNTSKTGSNLFSMRNLLWFSLVIILAGLLALTKKKRNQL